jgi:Putative transposase/Transposase zinc-binding domain
MNAVHTPMPHDLIACRAQDSGTRCGHAGTEAGTGVAPEVADIFRAYGDAYRATHRLSGQQLRVMQAIETCRTAALGGHMAQCDRCGAQVLRYHSCGNRHCPKCQTLAKLRWVQARLSELLDIPYFHCVLTLPHALNPLAQGNPQILYGLLFQSASATLQTFGRDPKWLGGEIGLTLVLHTWGQALEHHIHIHGIVTGGALAPDSERWIATKRRDFLFPVKGLGKVLRGKYLAGLHRAYTQGALRFAGSTAPLAPPKAFDLFMAQLKQHAWVVYAKPPFASAQQVISYLGRYTHRVAISNHRLVAFHEGQVAFRWRDYRHGNSVKVMTLSAGEFIRRFLLHTLPSGWVRMRHYGLLGNRCRAYTLPAARTALSQPPPVPTVPVSAPALMRCLTGIDIERCPHCRRGRLVVIATLYPLWPLEDVPRTTGPPL